MLPSGVFLALVSNNNQGQNPLIKIIGPAQPFAPPAVQEPALGLEPTKVCKSW